MKIHYTGRNAEITDQQKQKIETKFGKVQRILGRKAREAHVVLSRQRHLVEAEVTVRALSHTLVVTSSRVDGFSALQAALDKLEKQAVRNKHRMIDIRRPERQRGEPSAVAEAALRSEDHKNAKARGTASAKTAVRRPRVVRSTSVSPKPLTVEEALIHLEGTDLDQLTYRDAESGEIRVLLRRRDGNFELVEAS